MFQDVHRIELEHKSQPWLQGPLKHFRAAALAAALLPLASIAAAPAAAQCIPPTAGEDVFTICGYVYTDLDNDSIPDDGEGLSDVVVNATGNGSGSATTNESGYYAISVGVGEWNVAVDATTIPAGAQVEPPQTVNVASNNDVHDNVNFKVTSEGEDDLDGTVPSPCDFLTSGGFVIGDPVGNVAGKKVTFGIHGGCKHGEFWGHLNVVDHATGYHINSTEITGYLVPSNATDPDIREICGLATTNKSTDPSSVAFRVRLIDKGEPGRFDLFGIRLSTGYHVSTRLLSDIKPGGGNIQLHDPNPSTTAPEGPPQCWGLVSPD